MRRPKPFFRKQTQSWYVQIGKKQINLGRDEAKAFDQYHKIMAKREAFEVVDDSICNILNRYLDFAKENRAKSTYDLRRRYLRSFAQFIGQTKRISQLKKHHVQTWINDQYEGKSKSQNACITSLITAFNWAVKLDYIDKNPIAGMSKPSEGVREFFLPPKQWETVLNEIKDRNFGDVVGFMLMTGARPQEIRKIEEHHYDAENNRIVFSREESKDKKRQRVIYLNDESEGIVKRHISTNPDGPIFRNHDGDPWTKNAFNCRFRRLKKTLNMPELCAYTCRHSFAHWKLSSGIDTHIVAKLLGHADSRMLETRYGHIEANTSFMLKQAQRGDLPSLRTDESEPDSDSDTEIDHLD